MITSSISPSSDPDEAVDTLKVTGFNNNVAKAKPVKPSSSSRSYFRIRAGGAD